MQKSDVARVLQDSMTVLHFVILNSIKDKRVTTCGYDDDVDCQCARQEKEQYSAAIYGWLGCLPKAFYSTGVPTVLSGDQVGGTPDFRQVGQDIGLGTRERCLRLVITVLLSIRIITWASMKAITVRFQSTLNWINRRA